MKQNWTSQSLDISKLKRISCLCLIIFTRYLNKQIFRFSGNIKCYADLTEFIVNTWSCRPFSFVALSIDYFPCIHETFIISSYKIFCYSLRVDFDWKVWNVHLQSASVWYLWQTKHRKTFNVKKSHCFNINRFVLYPWP